MIVSQMPRRKKHHSVQLVGTIDQLHGQRKILNMPGPLEETSRYIRKITFQNRTWTLRSRGQSRDIQEQEFNRSSSRSRTLSELMLRSSTMSGSRRTKHPSKKDGSYLTALKETQDFKQFTSRLSAPLDKNPRQKNKAREHLKSHHDAMYFVDMGGPQKKNLKFYQTLICFFMCQVIHIRERADAKARVRGSVAHLPSKRATVTPSWSTFLTLEHNTRVRHYRASVHYARLTCWKMAHHWKAQSPPRCVMCNDRWAPCL